VRAQITALHASGTLIVLADQSLLQKARLAPYKLNDCSKTISSADCQDDACDGNATAALLTVYEPLDSLSLLSILGVVDLQTHEKSEGGSAAARSFQKDKAIQRDVFAKCMADRGYRVDPPSDSPKALSVSSSLSANPTQGAVPATAQVQSAQPDPKSAPASGKAASPQTGAVAGQLEELKSWFDRGLITEDEYKKKRSEILDRM